MQKLLAEAKDMKIPAQYTWFCSPSSLVQVKDLVFDVIAIVKTENSHYDERMKSVLVSFVSLILQNALDVQSICFLSRPWR